MRVIRVNLFNDFIFKMITNYSDLTKVKYKVLISIKIK